MVCKVKDIIAAMNQLAPESLAMEWDHVGLQIGSPEDDVTKVFLALDLTEGSLAEAMMCDPDMIITHHPFLFSPIQSIRTDRMPGKIIQQLLASRIALYAAHTNMDIAKGGLNDWVFTKLNLSNQVLLEQTSSEPLLKLVVYVPDNDVEKVADSLALAGAGHIGKYSHCSFRSSGIGTFKPLEGASPAIGSIGKIEQVSETRLETIVSLQKLTSVINAMIKVHPYEEVAYDVFQLHQKGETQGIGRIGELHSSIKVEEFIGQLKQVFKLETLRWVEASAPTITKVAVLTGSGASAIEEAAKNDCDALVTGDIKYHDAQLAESLDIHLFDVGHFESEICFTEIVEKHLKEYFNMAGYSVSIVRAMDQGNPIKTI